MMQPPKPTPKPAPKPLPPQMIQQKPPSILVQAPPQTVMISSQNDVIQRHYDVQIENKQRFTCVLASIAATMVTLSILDILTR
jgi:hypothetical protein